eukprot:COSAG05_NODE_1690_length_4271_cov_1.395254_2_plen_79_part_00
MTCTYVCTCNSSGCPSGCSEALLFGNLKCDKQCNTLACHWDNYYCNEDGTTVGDPRGGGKHGYKIERSGASTWSEREL